MVSPRRQLAHDSIAGQRQRVMEAVAELAHERRVADLAVADIIRRAGISRGAFYKLFEDRQSCLSFSCREAERQIFDPVSATLDQDRPWAQQLSAAIAALLDATAAAPHVAELCMIHSASVEGTRPPRGAAILERMLAGGRAAGRALRPGLPEPPPNVEALLAGGIVYATSCHRIGKEDDVADLHAELVRLCAVHFLGDQAASELVHAGSAKRERRDSNPRPPA
jgi:AcrR family transcriptional regulator